MLSTKTSAPPAAAASEPLHDPANREQFLESLRQRQLAAEARVSQLRDAVLEPPEAAAAANAESSDDDDEAAADGASEESSDAEDDEDASYENELEYYVGELLCIDAISHDPPSQLRAPHSLSSDCESNDTQTSPIRCALFLQLARRYNALTARRERNCLL